MQHQSDDPVAWMITVAAMCDSWCNCKQPSGSWFCELFLAGPPTISSIQLQCLPAGQADESLLG